MPGLDSVPMLWRAAVSRPAAIAMRTAMRPVPITRLQRSFGWVYAHAASPHPSRIDPHTVTDYGSAYADRARFNELPRLARALLADLRRAQLDRILDELEVPALQVWGKHDRLVPSRHARRQINAVVLPGCGHCPQLDSPGRVLDVIGPFLAGTAERPGSLTRAARS
jgi:pimeloyl-ACP methyl ester carboxylesterase